MKQSDNIYGINLQSEPDVNLPAYSFGTIFLLGNRSALADKVNEVWTEIIEKLDQRSMYYQYNLRILETTTEDFNIICPIQNPMGGRTFFLVAKSEIDELDYAVPSLINEVETQIRKFSEEALMMTAMEEPLIFKSVVGQVIVDGYDDDFPICGTEPFDPMRLASIYGIEAALDYERESIQKNKIANISERQRKEAFNNLPKKLSNAFEKQDPETCEIVRQTIGLWTPREQAAIVNAVASEVPWLLQKMQLKAMSAASRYEIFVRPWKSAYKNDFKDRYLYCIYLKNAKGHETPLSFKNSPAYCIYMMYIIDRVQRRENVTDLSLKNLRNEFCQLYKTIICETDTNINNYFDGLQYRINQESGMRRKGRYDDYIKDIHSTLESLVGEIDSIPFKVGHGRYLGILPERIHIDEKLAKIKIS